MRAVIYTRVSRDVSKGRSVQDQERECRALCEQNGWDVRGVFCDNDIGASRHSVGERPAWKKLKGDLRAGDILVVWEASRAQRDLEEFVELRNLCAQLNVPLSYAGRVLDLTLGDDRFVGGLDALIAEREAEQIRTRVLRGKRSAAADGRPPGGKPPWGYRRVDAGAWEPDPVEAPRIREAVERLLDGQSQLSVMRWLRSTGRAPAYPAILRRSLSNPALAGLRVHHGEVVGKAKWKPILTEEQHYKLVGRAQRLTALHMLHATPGPDPKHLLSGIATCGKCGKVLKHRAYPHRRPMYLCPDGHVARDAQRLDQRVLEKLFERLSQVNPAKFKSEDPGITAALREMSDIDEQLQKWIDASIAGEVTPAAFAKIEKGLLDRKNSLKSKTIPKDLIRVDIANLDKRWDRDSIRDKRRVIRAFLAVTVNPVGRRKPFPAGIDITPI